MQMASTSEELRKTLGVSEKEAKRLRDSVLGAYPKLNHTIQTISARKTAPVKGPKLSQVFMDEVPTIPVDVKATIDYSAAERSVMERLIESQGVPDHLLYAQRGGKTRSLKRTVVEAAGVEPQVASWYPLTDDEVDTEYDAMVADGRVTVLHDSVSFPLIATVHDEITVPADILAPYTQADIEATHRLYERLRSSDDDAPG